jgi:hypothetical protein
MDTTTLRRPTHAAWLAAALFVAAASCAYSPRAHAQAADDDLIRMYAAPDQFYLFNESDAKVLQYDTPRQVRICNETGRSPVPLVVNHDAKVTSVRPGDCTLFEAKKITLRPGAPLAANLDLSGTIEQRGMSRDHASTKRG